MASLKDDPKHLAAVERALQTGAKTATKKAIAAVKAVQMPEDAGERRAVKAALASVTAGIKAE